VTRKGAIIGNRRSRPGSHHRLYIEIVVRCDLAVTWGPMLHMDQRAIAHVAKWKLFGPSFANALRHSYNGRTHGIA